MDILERRSPTYVKVCKGVKSGDYIPLESGQVYENVSVVCHDVLQDTPPVLTSLKADGAVSGAAPVYVVVTAVGLNGETLHSNELTVITYTNTTSIVASWVGVGGATKYRVYTGAATGVHSNYVETSNEWVDLKNPALTITAGEPPATSTVASKTVTLTLHDGTVELAPITAEVDESDVTVFAPAIFSTSLSENTLEAVIDFGTCDIEMRYYRSYQEVNLSNIKV